MSKFNPANWKRHGNYYFRHKETGKVIHEETYYGKIHKLKEQDIMTYETIEEILQDAEEAAEYALKRENFAEHDGIMSVVERIRSEMNDRS
jgi:hypothetical protein